MTNANINSIQSQPNLNKGLRAEPAHNQAQVKTLGGLSAPTDYNADGNIDELEAYAHQLKTWLVENYTNPQVDWATLNQYIQYTDMNLGSNLWGELGLSPMGMGQMPGPQGGATGAANNVVFAGEDNEVRVDGSFQTADIWGNLTLNVPPPASVVAEISTDTRNQPHEQVIKYTVTNPAVKGPDGQPAKVVLFHHEYEGADIQVNTAAKPNGDSRVTDNTGGLITEGEFESSSRSSGQSEATVDPVEVDRDTNTYTYEIRMGRKADFTPSPHGGEEPITNIVYGDGIIYTNPSDQVLIKPGEDGEVIVTVTHRDDSVTVYRSQPGGHLEVFVEAEYVTFEGHEAGEDIDEIPSEIEDRVTVNTDESLAAASNATSGGDTAPDGPIEEHGGRNFAYYNESENVTLHADFSDYDDDDHIKVHNIAAPGEVNLYVDDFSNDILVSKLDEHKYRIEIYKGDQVIIYIVEGASKINIHGLESKIDGNAYDDDIFHDGVSSEPEEVSETEDGPSESADDREAMEIARSYAAKAGINQTPEEILAAAETYGLRLNYAPALPDESIFKFLTDIDSRLRHLLEEYKTGTEDERGALVTRIRDRFEELLQVIYPDSSFTPYGYSTITMDGRDYYFLNTEAGEDAEPWEFLRWEWESTRTLSGS